MIPAKFVRWFEKFVYLNIAWSTDYDHRKFWRSVHRRFTDACRLMGGSQYTPREKRAKRQRRDPDVPDTSGSDEYVEAEIGEDATITEETPTAPEEKLALAMENKTVGGRKSAMKRLFPGRHRYLGLKGPQYCPTSDEADGGGDGQGGAGEGTIARAEAEANAVEERQNVETAREGMHFEESASEDEFFNWKGAARERGNYE
jgi:hypothetical protein